jgi:hypothetical protein
MADEVDTQARLYFTVLDASGKAMPAVEYWAASPQDEQPAFQGLPLRKYVKLLGAGESLQEAGNGVFTGVSSGRRFVRAEGVGK